MSQSFQGPYGPLVLTICGPSSTFEGNWPVGPPYFDPCIHPCGRFTSVSIPGMENLSQGLLIGLANWTLPQEIFTPSAIDLTKFIHIVYITLISQPI